MTATGRRHHVAVVATPEELLDLLCCCTWTTCTGFRLGDRLWLNDSTGENGAQEYGVLVFSGELPYVGKALQIESITVSWCTPEELLAHIVEYQGELEKLLLDENVNAYPTDVDLTTPEQHGTCPACA